MEGPNVGVVASPPNPSFFPRLELTSNLIPLIKNRYHGLWNKSTMSSKKANGNVGTEYGNAWPAVGR